MSRSRIRGAYVNRDYTSVANAKWLQICRNSDWTYQYRTVDITPSVSHLTYDNREWMTDTIGEYYRYNPVAHTKYLPFQLPSSKLPRKTVTPVGYMYAGTWYTYGHDHGNLTTDDISFQSLKSTPGELPSPTWDTTDWPSLVYSVGQQLDGHMVAANNLLVDIVQIAQTVRMVKKPFQSVSKMVKGAEHLTLHELSKTASNSYLEYKFGWEQLYRSVRSIESVWKEVRNHMDYLKKTAGKSVSISARLTQDETPPSVSFQTYGNAAWATIHPYLTGVKRTAVFSLDVMRDQYALALSRMTLVMDRLGITKVSDALWDIVPYSFVVGWFTNIVDVCAQSPILWNSANLSRVGYSIKDEWFGQVDVTTQNYSDFGGWQTPSQVLTLGPQVVQKKYQRWDGFPSATSGVGLFGNLNQTQIAEGISLIVQRS